MLCGDWWWLDIHHRCPIITGKRSNPTMTLTAGKVLIKADGWWRLIFTYALTLQNVPFCSGLAWTQDFAAYFCWGILRECGLKASPVCMHILRTACPSMAVYISANLHYHFIVRKSLFKKKNCCNQVESCFLINCNVVLWCLTKQICSNLMNRRLNKSAGQSSFNILASVQKQIKRETQGWTFIFKSVPTSRT